MIEQDTAVTPAPPIGPVAGDPSFTVQATPDGFALITVTYGTLPQTLRLPIGDVLALTELVDNFVKWQPAPLPAA
jgi:hypothetical protein